MIIYDLACEPGGHAFEGWFASPQDFDDQLRQHLLRCPVCDSGEVRKVPAASHVRTPAAKRPANLEQARQALAALIDQVTRQSEDVGERFAEEARRMHYQEAPGRSIRGTATVQEVRELVDEGIPVLPLPRKPDDVH